MGQRAREDESTSRRLSTACAAEESLAACIMGGAAKGSGGHVQQRRGEVEGDHEVSRRKHIAGGRLPRRRFWKGRCGGGRRRAERPERGTPLKVGGVEGGSGMHKRRARHVIAVGPKGGLVQCVESEEGGGEGGCVVGERRACHVTVVDA